MKHMKKRAILSAVAMLVVTAIALSSATFAWFSAGTAVGVDQISATVANNDGSLLISADGTTWKTQLSSAEVKGVGTNIFPTDDKFTPVSAQVSNVGATIYAGSITSQKFTSVANATEGYIKYTVHLKANTDMDVTVTPNFASQAAFVYAAIEDGSQKLLLNGQGTRSYNAINAVIANVTDTNNDDIISDLETAGANLSAQGPAATSGSIDISLAANTAKTFTVFIWAEGQDAACSGPLSSQSTTMSLDIVKKA